MSTEFLKRLFGLEDQVAVVIGGGGLVGGALCEGFAQAGASLVIAGRSMARGHKRVEMVRALAGRAGFCHVDVTSRDSIQQLLEYTLGEYGRVDILVNCAGESSAEPFFEVTDDDWQRVLDTQLRGTHWACQIFGRHMARQVDRGCLLNIGGVASNATQSVAVAAARAAVVHLTKNVARELAPLGVRVNVLCPGLFPGESQRADASQPLPQQTLAPTPLGRWGEPRDLVGPALLLVSRTAGSYLTGVELPVDGGWTAMRF